MACKMLLAVGGLLLGWAASATGGGPIDDRPHGEHAVVFAPDGRWLAAAGSDGRIRIRDGVTGVVIATLIGHRETGPLGDSIAIADVAVSPDGRTIASASGDATVRLWDVERRAVRHVLKTSIVPNSNIGFHGKSALAFAPDGRTLASGDAGGFVELWDVEVGKSLKLWQANMGSIEQLRYSPDGATLAATGVDPVVTLWDTRTHALRRTIEQPGTGRLKLAYSPDGATLAVSGESEIVLRDPATGAIRDQFSPQIGYQCRVAFTPDGQHIVAGDMTGEAYLCAVNSRAGTRERCPFLFQPPHKDFSFHANVAVSPDGGRVAIGFSDVGRHIPDPNFKIIAIR